MQKKKVILFDLDGTLSQSEQGILNSIIYTLNKYERGIPSRDELRKFIGPPLHESFMTLMGVDEKQGFKAVDVYREYFAKKGIYENELYIGILDLLKELSDQGKIIGLATSKPEKYANQILEYFKIDGYFDSVTGAFMDGKRTDKTEIIDHALSLYPEMDKSDVVMIGDRRNDMIGACNHQVDCIGVAYGYGSHEELQEAGATVIVDSVEQLKNLLITKQ